MVAIIAIWAIVRKDIAIWLRQPTSIAVTLLPSLGLFIIVSLSASAVGPVSSPSRSLRPTPRAAKRKACGKLAMLFGWARPR